MSFLHPGWLLLGLILPLVLLGAVLAHRTRGKAWQKLVAPRLRQQLVQEEPQARRWISLSLGLLGCALLIIVIARPYMGKTTATEQIHTRNILIAVDTSRSMLVRDGSPDRMASAKAMALEITRALPNDRIGVIVFSGTSVLLAPLTIDHASVSETIGQLDTEVIPSGGSHLPSAAQIALKTFDKIGHHSNALIIISDGEDHSQAVEAVAEQIRDSKLAVSTVAVGTVDGGMIPDARQPDGKYRDTRGNAVHSHMIPEALKKLASAGGGTYTEASATAPAVIRDSLAFLESNQQKGRQIALPNEQYPWFLIPAILCLIASMLIRSHLFTPAKAAPLAACLIVLLTPQHSRAASDLDRASRAYQKEDYTAAMESFEKALDHTQGEDRRAVQFSIGSTAYRLEDWPRASRYFSKSLLSSNDKLRESSHYNLGNTLFQSAWSLFKPAEDTDPPQADNKDTETFQVENLTAAITQLEDCISHYDAALHLNHDHQDALHNRTEAEKLLKQLKEQQKKEQEKQQNDGQPKQGEGDKPKDKGDKPDQSPDQKGDGNQQDNNPKPDGNEKPPETPDQNGGEKPDEAEQPEKPDPKQQPGETDEAYAARILKDNADAETRPVKSRFLRLRRPAKDW